MGGAERREGRSRPGAPAPGVPSGDEALLHGALAASQLSVLEWDCGCDRLSVRGPFWSQIARPAPEAPGALGAFLDIVEGADRPGLEAAIRRAAEVPETAQRTIAALNAQDPRNVRAAEPQAAAESAP